MRFFLLVAFGMADLVLMVVIVCVELVGRLLRKLRPIQVPSFPSCRPECTFVMITWHGKQALKQSMPALVRAVQKVGGNHEIIVVVDYEIGEGTENYLRNNFPDVRVVASNRSLYFNAATRLAISKATRDIVVVVNNDAIVDENFLPPLLKAFGDPAVFGVASRVVEHGGGGESGKTLAKWRDGRIVWCHEPVTNADEEREFCEVSWLHRGAYAFDRRKFHCLGNFDHIYDPLFFEDADLSLRAWRAGWKCLLATNSKIKHQHPSGLQDRGKEFSQTIMQRNGYIFFWRNIDDVHGLTSHFVGNTRRRIHKARELTSARTEMRAFVGACKRLPRIITTRIRLDRMSVRSTTEVLGTLSGMHPDQTSVQTPREAV